MPRLDIPPRPSLQVLASGDPSSIDRTLLSDILNPGLPNELVRLLADCVNRCVTPEAQWGGDPSRTPSQYRDTFIAATLLGRAYTLLIGDGNEGVGTGAYLGDLEEEDYVGQEWRNDLCTKPDWQEESVRQQRVEQLRSLFTEYRQGNDDDDDVGTSTLLKFSELPMELRHQIFEHYSDSLCQRRKLWSIISSTFIKALLSGCDPEPLARYGAGVLVLTCGHALSRSRHLTGKGEEWGWIGNQIGLLEHFWTWRDLEQAIMQTEDLPRNNTNAEILLDSHAQWASARPREGEPPEYVPKEVLHILDEARKHLKTGSRDWNSREITTFCLEQLSPGNNNAEDEAMATEELPPYDSLTESSQTI